MGTGRIPCSTIKSPNRKFVVSMNVSSIWSLVVATSSLQMSLFHAHLKKIDLKATLQELVNDFGLPRISVYDYVIGMVLDKVENQQHINANLLKVGGGAAGCLIAGRLAESGHKVILLEKGGDPPPPIMNPLLPNVLGHPSVNDVYMAVPQRHSWQRSAGVGSIEAGIMLGGSGGHNGFLYNRGSPYVYGEWAQFLNDPTFAYESMLSRFKENEEMTGFLFSEHEREAFYGTNGPFRVDTDIPLDFGDWFETGHYLGFKEADPNAHLEPSFTTAQVSTRDGLRETSYTAFILRRPNPNLKIFRFSNVQKILIEDRSAYGVVFLRHGIPQIVLANTEVILTAGTMVSPLILIRSGIGPDALLKESKIPSVLDLPGVGHLLQDHPVVRLPLTIQKPKTAEWNDSQIVKLLSSYPEGRKSISRNCLQAFIQTSISPVASPCPDIQLQVFPDFIDTSKSRIEVFLVRPKSTGTLRFNTSSLVHGETESTKIVRVDPNYFSNQRDMDTMIEGLDFVFNRILPSPRFMEKGYSLEESIMEGCTAHLPYSKMFWKCFVEWRASTAWHVIGTCRMGADGDQGRVVDTEFRVIGIDKLRVADASVVPILPNSNTHAPVLAIAAKAVHAIKGARRKRNI